MLAPYDTTKYLQTGYFTNRHEHKHVFSQVDADFSLLQ